MTTCHAFERDLIGILEGTAEPSLQAHVATCDACRDGVHGLSQLAARLGRAGDDHPLTPPLAERLAELARSERSAVASSPATGERISGARLRTAPPVSSPPKSRRALWLILAATVSVAASVAVGVKLADRQRSPVVVAQRPWSGKVAKIAKSGPAQTEGLSRITAGGKAPIAEGEALAAGTRLVTDAKTRARLAFDDGTVLVLDRGTEATIEGTPRTLTLHDGAVLADVAHVEGAPAAMLKTANGDVKVLGTKVSVTATGDRTNVEVLRGEVEVSAGSVKDTHRVAAGQEAVVGKDGRVDVAPANDMAQRAAFGEQLLVTHNEDAEAPANGLGELRAKRPGKTDEKDHAVRLAKHAVKVRIAGNVARTEIDETFANDTDDELEGIFRFPLPPGAQIERLALEVDGKLLDGEFVDKAKAAAIWRGAIQNAAPKAPKPKEEIVWVPGPWHDPALLEWQRGGRFELRIFPIPKRGARRVVIAYTETVAPTAGVRRYVYPLPQGSSSAIAIDDFSIDAQVLGHDAKVPVRARGYELERKSEGGVERLVSSVHGFAPSGDLAIEYGLDDRATDATAWAYRAPPAAAGTGAGAAKTTDPVGDDPFVAIALRPKLPRWSDAKPRDQVIVVDAGRAMYGERFARAKRLAVQMTQEMDRRDRLTVIACDVACKTLPGGFVAPGAPSAHDVDAFLAGIVPDGASDLVSAVRSAAKLGGRDGQRDLRVAVLSDGVVTAGYRSPGRLATEVGEALADPRAELVAVPIGADADVTLLSDVARGGGGVVVPYQPGQRLEATALEVLNATYGTALRDVEVVLPPGLRDVAPAIVPPMRAGSETVITARMAGDAASGDVIVRGKVGGEPFEAKYPIDVRASTDLGNAFVPRLFAAARIAERERLKTTTDAARAELVTLSRRFAVPSRTTSLLVLESEAMFKAFGIERAAHAPSWTGEAQAHGVTVASATEPESPARDTLDAFSSGDDEPAKKKDTSIGGFGRGGGGVSAESKAVPAPAPAATMAAPRAADVSNPWDDGPPARRPAPRWRGGGQFMRRTFVQKATLSADASPGVLAEKVMQARAAVAAAPDERSKHRDLARVLALSGQLDELGDTLEKWSSRDPLDADVIAMRADVAARRGDREGSLRILGGALAASAMPASDAFALAEAVARSYDRLGKSEACAFHVAAAELRPTDADAVARAVLCERAQGRTQAAERFLDGATDAQRKAVAAGLQRVAGKPETAAGDIVVNATWTGGADVDVVLVDPSGRRAGTVSRLRNARVEGAMARDHETVALSSRETGTFLVEVVRANAVEGTGPVSGTVTLRAFGQTQAIPFTLTGARAPVGRVDVRWEAALVPVSEDVEPANAAVFDRAAAAAALGAIRVQSCSAGGQTGTGHAMITFGTAGNVTDVTIDDAIFAGTPTGRCVANAFFSARVPAFSGTPARVGKSFTIAP